MFHNLKSRGENPDINKHQTLRDKARELGNKVSTRSSALQIVQINVDVCELGEGWYGYTQGHRQTFQNEGADRDSKWWLNRPLYKVSFHGEGVQGGWDSDWGGGAQAPQLPLAMPLGVLEKEGVQGV